MAHNFTTTIHYNGQTLLAVIVPVLRKDGMHYEVNIPGVPRFFVKWSALDRYDIIGDRELKIPDALILEVSDAIEAQQQ